jgi:hypothetical protein
MSIDLPRLHESQTVDIAAPAGAVWDVVKDFDKFTWMPGVQSSDATNGNSVGSIRTLNFGGPELIEELVSYEAERKAYTYRILDTLANRATAPVGNLMATISVKAITEIASQATWEGTFNRADPSPNPGPEADEISAAKQIKGTFVTGLTALKKHFNS